MNESLHITERIDEVLNILNNGPYKGYDQWKPIITAIEKLAGISIDIRNYEKENASPPQADEPDTNS